MKTKKLSGIIALALTIGLCQTAVPADAAAPTLSTKKLNLKVSQTVTLKVKKTNKKAKWSVLSGKKNVRLSAKKKASVKVKALKAGKAKISCKLGKKKLICNVVVKGSSKSEKNAEQKATPTTLPTQSPAVTPVVTPSATPSQTPKATEEPLKTHEPTENRIMVEPAVTTSVPYEHLDGQVLTTVSRHYFFGTDVLRKDIERLTFSDSAQVPDGVINSFDLSEKQNKSVMAWYTDQDANGLYEMTVGQEKGVVANPDSTYLCCEVGKISGIENLYTTEVKDMSMMFYEYNAATLGDTTLDLGNNFDTSNVEKMDSMFYNSDHMFSALTLRIGRAFSFKNVKSSVCAFWLGDSGSSKIIVSNEEQKNFIADDKNSCLPTGEFVKTITIENN